MIEATLRRDLTYHLPGRGYVVLAAGTPLQVVDPLDYSRPQRQLVDRAARDRVFEHEGASTTIAGEQLEVIRWAETPDGWTSVPRDAVAFPSAWGAP